MMFVKVDASRGGDTSTWGLIAESWPNSINAHSHKFHLPSLMLKGHSP